MNDWQLLTDAGNDFEPEPSRTETEPELEPEAQPESANEPECNVGGGWPMPHGEGTY